MIKMNILIICVNYNSYKEVHDYLDSISRAFNNSVQELSLEVVVVDNSVNKERIMGSFPYRVKQLFPKENLGYLKGLTYGLIKEYDSNINYTYIIYSNVDLIITDNFFNDLSSLEIDDCVGCIAPSIYSINEKRDRNPKIMQRISKNKLKILKMFYRYPWLNTLYEKSFFRYRRNIINSDQEGYIYAPHGSFMIFRSPLFKALMEIYYPVLLFGEEIYIAEVLRKNELKTFYTPRIRVIDYDHVSTGKLKNNDYYRLNYLATEMLLKEFFDE